MGRMGDLHAAQAADRAEAAGHDAAYWEDRARRLERALRLMLFAYSDERHQYPEAFAIAEAAVAGLEAPPCSG